MHSQRCEDNCVCGLVIFLIIYYIAYVIYGTYSLIVDYSIWHDCYKECNTKIWIYCLLSILLGFDKIYIRKKIVVEYGLLILCMVLIVEVLLFVWGITELFNKTQCIENKCLDIYRTHLWAFAHLCFVLQIIFVMLYSLLMFYKVSGSKLRYREVEIVSFDML